jgi:hypothetical protein
VSAVVQVRVTEQLTRLRLGYIAELYSAIIQSAPKRAKIAGCCSARMSRLAEAGVSAKCVETWSSPVDDMRGFSDGASSGIENRELNS